MDRGLRRASVSPGVRAELRASGGIRPHLGGAGGRGRGLQPRRDSSIFKSGSVVPTKFQLAFNGAYVANATATIEVFYYTNVILGTVEEITPDAAGQSITDIVFRYDSGTKQYIYNLKTTGYDKGTYLVRANVSDGTKHDVRISIK